MDSVTRTALRNAVAVYVAWVAATYLLEGMVGTLLRPEAIGLRLAYAIVANLFIGILLPLWVIRSLLRARWARASDFGFSGARRTAASVVAAAVVGYALFAQSQAAPVPLLITLNSFAQVWVVSVAEIVVCWALVGATLFISLRRWSRWGAYLIASSVASVLFGVYHFAHSAPFNEVGMVLFLTGIGFVTSLWWFVSRDAYGTAIFHNFFGVTGVLAALRAGGHLPEHPTLAVPLVAMAGVATLALVVLELRWIKRPGS
jgi:hypothetical protein